jgi:hypothetical protein
MKQKLFIFSTIILLILVTCCKRTPQNLLLLEKGKSQTCLLCLLQQIDSLVQLGEYDSDIFGEYIEKAEEFCTKYPEDPTSAEFLYKAGLMAMSLAKFSDNIEEKGFYSRKAIGFFDSIQMIYPEFHGLRKCILNKCILYDEILNDHENAEVCFREYIGRYSADTLTINIDSYLQYLGKSAEEFLSEIEK